MALTAETWRSKAKEELQRLKQVLREGRHVPVYGAAAALALWPVVQKGIGRRGETSGRLVVTSSRRRFGGAAEMLGGRRECDYHSEQRSPVSVT